MVKKGDKLVCGVCGVELECVSGCGCCETDIVCCGKPMEKKARKASKPKKKR